MTLGGTAIKVINLLNSYIAVFFLSLPWQDVSVILILIIVIKFGRIFTLKAAITEMSVKMFPSMSEIKQK